MQEKHNMDSCLKLNFELHEKEIVKIGEKIEVGIKEKTAQ
jgi:hypothetical protein